MPCPQACGQQAAYLSDHRKAHDEETDTATQSEDRLVCAQVLGELVRDGGHDGLNGGKLEWGPGKEQLRQATQPQSFPKSFVFPTRESGTSMRFGS